MANGKIVALYTPPRLRPMRFAVYRGIALGVERFEVHHFFSLSDLIRDLLVTLSATRNDFMTRAQELDDKAFQESRHKTRRYVADRRDLLYINSPHLTDHSMYVLGCWVATNVGRKEVYGIIDLACTAAGVKHESRRELKLWGPPLPLGQRAAQVPLVGHITTPKPFTSPHAPQ